MSGTGLTETVLVVDDSAANRHLARTWLRHAGFQVAEAQAGYEALELLQTIQPDLVVLDVNLPDLNGKEVCRRIKADPAQRGVPVVHTSAASILREDRIEAVEGGADAYVTTPVPVGEFLAVVRSLLRLRRAEREARQANERWELAFRGASIGMLLLDAASGKLLRANPAFAAMVGRSEEDLAGLEWRDLGDPDDGPADEARLARFLQSDHTEPLFEYRWLRPGGISAWALVSLTALPGPDGRVNVLAHAQDLTALRRAENEREAARAEAEAANRATSDFLFEIGHELCTPLNAILGFAQLLTLDDLTPHQQESAEQVLRAGRHLADLIEGLVGRGVR